VQEVYLEADRLQSRRDAIGIGHSLVVGRQISIGAIPHDQRMIAGLLRQHSRRRQHQREAECGDGGKEQPETVCPAACLRKASAFNQGQRFASSPVVID